MSAKKILPISLIFSAVLLLMHILLYKLSGVLAEVIGIVKYVPKIAFIDDRIPIVPVFIVVYVLAYLFWLLCPVVNSMADRERYTDYVVGFAIAYVIGFVWLCLFPAVMDRTAEHIEESLGNDIFSRIHLWFITDMDSGEIAHGLLPSFHSMTSVYCYLGVRKCKEIPKWLRIFIFVFALSIVLSTLFLKQHYILDAIAGTSLAILSYLLARKLHLGKTILPLIKEKQK